LYETPLEEEEEDAATGVGGAMEGAVDDAVEAMASFNEAFESREASWSLALGGIRDETPKRVELSVELKVELKLPAL